MLSMLLPLIPVLTGILNKVIPDPQAQAQAKLELLRLTTDTANKELDAQLKQILGQLTINQNEASSGSIFVAGWRPFIGWTCGAAFAYAYVVGPLFTAFMGMFGIHFNLVPLDLSQIMGMTTGMLGLAGLRTYEKINKQNFFDTLRTKLGPLSQSQVAAMDAALNAANPEQKD